MASTIKVDQIQLSDGSTPTAADLGLGYDAGDVVQVQTFSQLYGIGSLAVASSTWVATEVTVNITPKFANSKLHIDYTASMSHSQSNWMALAIGVNGVKLGGSTESDAETNYVAGYQDNSTNQYSPTTAKLDYTVSSTDPVTVTIYMKTSGNSERLTHPWSSVGLTVTEIAQ